MHPTRTRRNRRRTARSWRKSREPARAPLHLAAAEPLLAAGGLSPSYRRCTRSRRSGLGSRPATPPWSTARTPPADGALVRQALRSGALLSRPAQA